MPTSKRHETKLAHEGSIICMHFYELTFWFPNGKCIQTALAQLEEKNALGGGTTGP